MNESNLLLIEKEDEIWKSKEDMKMNDRLCEYVALE